MTDAERKAALQKESHRLHAVADQLWRQYVDARAAADCLSWGVAALEVAEQDEREKANV